MTRCFLARSLEPWQHKTLVSSWQQLALGWSVLAEAHASESSAKWILKMSQKGLIAQSLLDWVAMMVQTLRLKITWLEQITFSMRISQRQWSLSDGFSEPKRRFVPWLGAKRFVAWRPRVGHWRLHQWAYWTGRRAEAALFANHGRWKMDSRDSNDCR